MSTFNLIAQATPHVAGIIATLISRDGNLSPAAMSAKLATIAIKGAITDLRKPRPAALALRAT